jgi:pimeloyl-[acyl-carrier protein] methyl ester esterase
MHIESIGSGEPLLLIHGWGMHGGVWDDVAQKMAADFRVLIVDLPGYGYSKNVGWVERSDTHHNPDDGYRYAPPILLDALVDELSSCFSEPLNVCGWSLGGQIALRWAMREPEKVCRIILVASTPCFSEREDWSFGMEKTVLEKFADELEHNHAATLRRFLTLQLRGSDNERELLAILRERLFSRGEPDMRALRAGLNILRDVDLRGELHSVAQPTLVIAGERDKLTPPEASRYLEENIPLAHLVELKGAAHAPFLSHPDEFVMQMKNFIGNKIN